MKYFLYILAFILCMCATVKPVSADTSIPSGLISKDTILLKSKSPYVLSGMTTVKQGIKFSIESGVKIVFNGGGLFLNKSNLTGKSFTIESKSFGNNALITCDGCSIDLQGVQVEGSPQSFISAWNHSAVVLAEVEINFAGNSQNTTGIQVFNNSTLIVSDSIFSRLHKAIELFNNSTSTITNSYFAYNMHGIYAFNSDMHISQNDFENNRIAIEYFSNDGFDHRVDARDNWWGNKDAPIQKEYASNVLQEDMNVLVGEIEYTPWSLMPHKLKKEEGSSNILFLPGLMGSRLYKKDTFENQLWEPNRNKDVRNLFLTPLGKSMQSGIYTRDIIDKTNIVGGVTNLDQNLYKDFMVHMNSLVKNKTIQAWKSAPYDWRYSADTILEDGISV
ncbi:MAG: right-handed parallel beta-helix repeat-containing protein, partial [Patescibacteria group bacterium]